MAPLKNVWHDLNLVFVKMAVRGETVTAGNATGIDDGAAAVVLTPYTEALEDCPNLGQSGVDPSVIGTGPILATKKALEKAVGASV